MNIRISKRFNENRKEKKISNNCKQKCIQYLLLINTTTIILIHGRNEETISKIKSIRILFTKNNYINKK